VFYLHSRLLERSAKLSHELGGGSMTAIPIVETMVGDISAYIPTNVISITDGQIYLQADMFSAGQRPAINVGLSVSRVGRAAQHPAMRDVSGSLRLEVAQYCDIAVFAQFGADIDTATAAQLRRGERLTELLIQPAARIYTLAQQIILLLAASSGVFEKFAVHELHEAVGRLLNLVAQNAPSLVRSIEISKKLNEPDKADLTRLFKRFISEIGDNDAENK
jgi:F-type H+-transporting ATPase subunit alpha